MLNQLPFPTKTETLALTEAADRVCAEDVISPINVPSFDNSAMDGYAVRLADLQQSMTLSIAGKSFAGNPFQGEWVAQSAVRIMTGAMIPEAVSYTHLYTVMPFLPMVKNVIAQIVSNRIRKIFICDFNFL